MKNKSCKKIDFVIPWVDGNDKKWRVEKEKFRPSRDDDDREQRYRDWDNLQYLFRGIEKFTPWVNRVYFITCGHYPEWLNLSNPKLKLITHEQILPADVLPVFNVFPIEVNLHRIPGLSEHFVYFNDDMFLLKSINQDTFFKDGLPCDTAALSVHCYSEENWFHMAAFKNAGVMNKYFDMHETIKNNVRKWANIRYGKKNIQTLVLYGCPRFPGFWYDHMPQSFLKSTFEDVWDVEKELLEVVTKQRFRSVLTVNQWLFKDWQLCKGSFVPRSWKTGKSFECSHGTETALEVADYIIKQRGKMICVNDGVLTEDEFETSKETVNTALDRILPEKSSFEK